MTSVTLGRLLGAAALAGALPAAAQQGTPAPTPAPGPAPAPRPTIITIPGAEKFDLRGPRSTTPAQTPAPSPAPSPAAVRPPPIPVATPRQATQPRPAPTPAPTRAAPVAAAPTPAPSPAATAAPPPVAQPAPVASAAPSPVPLPVPTPAATGLPAWGPWAAGAAGVLVLGLLGWLFARARKRRAEEARRAARRAAAQAAPPPPPAVPRAAPRPAAPPPPPPAPPPSGEPIAFELRALGITVAREGVTLEYDLLVANLSDKPIEGIRVSLAMIPANPQQDSWIEGFHSVPGSAPIAQDVVLQPKSAGKIAGKVTLPHDRIHVVEVGGRPMFVPLVMVDARWRGGLSIRQTGSDFMVGTAGQGMKLGPIWLDRGAMRIEGLAANRYFRKSQVQAAE